MELLVKKLLLIYQNNENWAIFRAVLRSRIDQGGLESGGKDNAKQTNECLLRAL